MYSCFDMCRIPLKKAPNGKGIDVPSRKCVPALRWRKKLGAEKREISRPMQTDAHGCRDVTQCRLVCALPDAVNSVDGSLKKETDAALYLSYHRQRVVSQSVDFGFLSMPIYIISVR